MAAAAPAAAADPMALAATSTDLPSFDEQRHQLGPFVSRRLNDRWILFGGALAGLTEASPDVNLRLWLTRRL